MAGRYADTMVLLREDESELKRMFILHTTVHGCGEGSCEARQVIEDAHDRMRALLAREGT